MPTGQSVFALALSRFDELHLDAAFGFPPSNVPIVGMRPTDANFGDVRIFVI